MDGLRRVGIAIGLVLFVGGAVSCQKDRDETRATDAARTGDPSAVVARVGEDEIRLGEVDRLVRLWKTGGMPGVDTMAAMNLQERALETLIDQELLVAASRAAGFAPAPEEVAATIERYAGQYPSPEAFRDALDGQGMTEEEFRDAMVSDMAIRRYLQGTIPDTSTLGPDDARAFYDQNPQMFQTGERFRARHIFVDAPRQTEAPDEEARSADDRARWKADSLLAEIRGGADFAAVAREASGSGPAAAAGEVMEFGHGEMLPGLEAVYALDEGETSEVLRSAAGYHIVHLEERIASHAVSYDSRLESHLLMQMRSEQQGRAVQRRIQELREGASIERSL